MIIKGGLGNICWNFCNKTVVLFVLVKMVLISLSKDRLKSKCRPRWFWKSALRTEILLQNISGWIFLEDFLLKMTTLIWSVGSRLKLIFYWKAHLFISLSSLFRLLTVLSSTFAVENRDLFSVNDSAIDWRFLRESLIGRKPLYQGEKRTQ